MNLLEMMARSGGKCENHGSPPRDALGAAEKLRALQAALAPRYAYRPGMIVRQRAGVHRYEHYHLATPLIVLDVVPADEAEREDGHFPADLLCALWDEEHDHPRTNHLCSVYLEPYPEEELRAYAPLAVTPPAEEKGIVSVPPSVLAALDPTGLERAAEGARGPRREYLQDMARKAERALADLVGPERGTLQ